MRVALLSLNARAGDAVGQQIASRAGYFLDRGTAVSVVLSDDRYLHPALKPITVRHNGRAAIGPGWRALQQADLVVIAFTQYYPLLEMVPMLADGRRKIIVEYYGLTPSADAAGALRSDLIRGEEWRGLAHVADAVICHSRFTAHELEAAVGPLCNRLHRVPLGIDPLRFAPAATTAKLRQRFGSEPLMLFVGRVAPNKRLPTLIRAVAELRDLSVNAAVIGPCGDGYEPERLACQELAADLDVADRVHFLGAVDEPALLDAYRSADALVIPSRHEGFSLPAVEAMACGLPVIAARAGALAETVGAAGLTFAVDDPLDLAKQVRRLLAVPARPTVPTKHVAVVMPRHGQAAGGLERSLTRLACGLHQAGYAVEVFATGNVADELPYPVHVFPATPVDSSRREAAMTGHADEIEYWRNTLRSPELIQALAQREAFDAVFVGPYLTGLTRDVVRAVGARAILVPCLHDERQVRLPAVRAMFDSCGGVLFHSDEERTLAHSDLALNHVNEETLGTWIDADAPSNPERGKARVGSDQYVVYCGRHVAEKGLASLFDFARRYDRAHPGQLRFVFVGAGDIEVPREPWARRLGQLDEQTKRDVMAGAVALVQPSANESLSLVVLEANAVGTPVLVNAAADVLAGYVARCGGGSAFASYESFAAALNHLIADPTAGNAAGARGRQFVVDHFTDAAAVVARASHVIQRMNQPLTDVVRENGQCRAAELSIARWRHAFNRVVDAALESDHDRGRPALELSSTEANLAGQYWSVLITHRGGRALAPMGLGRTEMVVRLRHIDGEVVGQEWIAPLINWVAPGTTAVVHVALPTRIHNGTYELEAGLRHCGRDAQTEWFGPLANWQPLPNAATTAAVAQGELGAALDRARGMQDLPDGYVDVTVGRAARVKRWLKRKLLHNFRAGYVDVLSRQQSEFNRRVLHAVQAAAANQPRQDALLRAEVADLRRRCDELEQQLAPRERAGRAARQEAA